MVYRSYRTKKYRKISNFRHTKIFGTLQYRIVSFRYDNDMNFIIPRYTALYGIYDIYRYYQYTEIYRKSIRIELSMHTVYNNNTYGDVNNVYSIVLKLY